MNKIENFLFHQTTKICHVKKVNKFLVIVGYKKILKLVRNGMGH